jgi:hypothetical protein
MKDLGDSYLFRKGRVRKRYPGLRTAQIRIMKALNVRGGLSKRALCDRVKTEFKTAASWSEWIQDPMGSQDDDVRAKQEQRLGYKTLIGLGYVSTVVVDVVGKKERLYCLTDLGREALAEVEADRERGESDVPM